LTQRIFCTFGNQGETMTGIEQELIRQLFERQEGVRDLNETLSAINTAMKEGKVTDHVREMIVTILPENPETESPPHRLCDAETMLAELMSEEAGERVLTRYRDYFERVQSHYARKILQIKAELAVLEESKLQRLNDWWQGCNADEREIGYEAITELLKSNNSARILAKADTSERVKLLAYAEKAVKAAKEQACQQTEAWKKLSKTEQVSVLEAVQKTSGMPANIWWQKATLLERNRVLGKILSTLANVRQDPIRKTKAL
jgi:hypothetical protein